MKLTIVINGMGGVGKDTLCRFAAERYKTENISSITPIKELAAVCGWQGGKSDRDRKFLSDLKALTAEYNDYPTNYLLARYRAFLSSGDELLFVHIREPGEIEKFVRKTDGGAITLLVRGGERFARAAYGNASDDGVEDYPYDYVFVNDLPLDKTGEAFLSFLDGVIRERGN
jgi:hypothetical protein